MRFVMHRMPFRTIRLLAPAIFLIVALAAGAGHAEPPNPADATIEAWDLDIDRIAARIKSGRTGTLEERQLRKKLQSIAASASAASHEASAKAGQVRSLLAALGSKPKQGDDSPSVRKRRQALESDIARLEGRAKQLNLTLAKSNQVLSELEAVSRRRLKAQLLEHTITPIGYKAWAVAIPEAQELLRQTLRDAPRSWWREHATHADARAALARDLIVAFVIALVAWFAGRWMRRHFGRVRGIAEPSYARRVFAGLVEGVGRTLAPIVFVVLAGLAVKEVGAADAPMAVLTVALMKSLSVFFLGHGLINAALTPKRQQWRLLDLNVAASRFLVARLKLTLAVFLVLNGSRLAALWASPSAELEAVSALVFSLAMAPLLISLLGNRAWQRAGATAAVDTSPIPRSRLLMKLAIASFPLIAAFGYPGLATYLVKSVVLTAVVGAAGMALRAVGRETVNAGLDPRFRLGRALGESLALNEAGARKIAFWLRIGLDVFLLAAAALVLPPVWGFSREQTAGAAANLLNGIQIGAYSLSPVDILVGLILFSAVIFVTRIVQRGMERHLLPNLSSDKGVRDALKTGIGYAGFVIAVLVGVSALGLDLSNLALIAGALSVGLGFGLQNVVNNFVSGLILLVERPIKPGDWVVVGGNEGNVKKVNVRSTEIETFQRASVIIPNADLISTPVVNWTHKNMLGRVEIRVGVAYGTDPRLVESILVDCAKAHANVITSPPPNVLFMDFGDSALIFELRAFLHDVEKRLLTASELRFAINDALRAKGVEIPFPQRVVHMAPAESPPKD